MKNWILLGMAAMLFCALGCGTDAPKMPPSENTAAAQPAENTANPPAAQAMDTAAKPAAPAQKIDSILPENPASGAAGAGAQKPPQKMESIAPKRKVAGLDAAKWTDVAELDKSIVLDIKYATEDNFTKSKIYDCPRCFLRPEAAVAIAKAHEKLQKERGYGLKMFDCYRPRPYQQRLWDKVPNPDYVTPPKKGSMHSRGAAVDLTIVDKKGKELDMGTPYDFFGEKAHTDFKDLPEKVLQNRILLKKTLESVGFKGIRTEWWHFSFGKKDYELSSDLWECE